MGPPMSSAVWMALCSSALALAVSVAAAWIGHSPWLLVAAPAAAFITAWATWTLFISRTGNGGLVRGAGVGALASLVAHWATWYLVFVGMNVCYFTVGECVSSSGEAPADLIIALAGAAGFSLWSLMFFGWLTLPAGALIGAATAWRQSRRLG